ncbi:MAG: LysR family transcriptional regulator [Proteobacteria bacterium]|nr:LysR family transcriptional regulator [Pseudomonadota bacterium]
MKPRRLPSLLALRAFEATARHLSFTKAAGELHVTQSAVSRHVRSLEDEFGRPLFVRMHRAVVLTEAGRKFAEDLSAGFLQIHRAVEALDGVKSQRLRVSAEPAFAARWLLERLGRFSIAHPQVELELETSDELRVLGRDADIAIRYIASATHRPRGRYRPLLSMQGVPVIAGVRPRPRHWNQDSAVQGHRLLHDDDGSAWRKWFAAAGLEGFEKARHLHFTDYSLALAAAERGQGVALGSDVFIEAELRNGRLAQLGRTRVPFGEYVLLEAAGGASAAQRSLFVRWLESELARR